MFTMVVDLSVESEERLYDDSVIAWDLDSTRSDIYPDYIAVTDGRLGNSEEGLRAVPCSMLAKMLDVRYPRTRGDLLEMMERLRLIRRVRDDGPAPWRVCEPLPDVLDLPLTADLRAFENFERERSKVLVFICRATHQIRGTELARKHSLLLDFFGAGWDRWLPRPVSEIFITVVDLSVENEERLYSDYVIARNLDPARADIYPFSESDPATVLANTLPIQVLMKVLATRYPRTRGALLDIMEKLRLIRRVRVNDSKSWRVCEPVPRVLDLPLPLGFRVLEIIEQSKNRVLAIMTRPTGAPEPPPAPPSGASARRKG